MAFTYTEIFSGKSPLRGGTPISAMAAGTWGSTGALAATAGQITSNLASCKLAMVFSSIGSAASGGLVLNTSTNVITIGVGIACSGTYMAFGI